MTAPASDDIPGKWPTLLILSAAQLLAMAVWFSASAVVGPLTALWELGDSGRSWLTMSVQAGFVAGALASALLNLADRIAAPRLFAVCAVLAGVATALIPVFPDGPAPAMALRFLTGLLLAGVYPVGMKIMAGWTRRDRGLGIGLLVGALTIGSASPHLVNALGGTGDWRLVLHVSAALAIAGGLLCAATIREGPFAAPAPRFNAKYVAHIFSDRDLVLANLGYLGHMWEVYAMWAWIPGFLIGSFAIAGVDAKWGSAAAFAVIAAGGLGSLVAGILADRIGRTPLAIASLVVSGACCLTVGFLYGGSPIALTALCLVWGFAVVADSAQFSACVSELADREYVGTALTLQTSLGFLLTLATIRLVPTMQEWVGVEHAFAFLAVGPALGVWAMWALRRSPAASKLAGGRG